MQDYLVRIVAKDANIRGLACVSTQLVEEARLRHGTYPTASAALGRALTAGTLMGALLKTGQRVALKFEGNGPLRKILVEAESNGAVRGYVGSPQVELPPKNGKFDISAALGRVGLLTVTKDLRLKEPYSGVVELYTGEIAEDVAYYLAESEQIPSAVGLGVYVEQDGHVSAAGGFLIQALPPSEEALIDRIVEQIGRLPSVTQMLRSGKMPEDVLSSIFEGIPFDLLEKRVIAFECSCSRARVERAILSLGRDQLLEIKNEGDAVDVTCEFCHETFTFSQHDLDRMVEELSQSVH